MSFMNSGAECSTSRNPLAQFTKHSSEDRTLQHERLGPGGLHGSSSMRTNGQEMSFHDAQAMNMFNPAEAAAKQGMHLQNNTFRFDQMNHEMANIHSRSMASRPAAENWSSDFAAQHSSPANLAVGNAPAFQNSITGSSSSRHNWAGEFSGNATPVEAISARPGIGFSGRLGAGLGSGLGYMPSAPVSMMNTRSAVPTTADSHKIIQLNDKTWEEEFNKIELSHAQVPATEVSKEGEEESKAAENTEETVTVEDSDFESVWENIRHNVMTSNNEDMDQSIWDRDFDQFAKNRTDFGEYLFEEENHFATEADPFQIGVQLMESGGNISEAALAFEAAVQKNPDHSEAWGRLGACQAQNEKEDPAIRALERCITLDAGNLTALMNLAVSYINQSYENAAYSTLEKWISTKYPEIVDKARTQEPSLENEDRYQLHSRVTELFLRAAQLSPTGANMDADVQDGLGVLFYGSEDYEKAVDCFTSAITARPDDALLWNRLGATLANSDRSEEAIEAYSRALQLRPSFVRARYNLGVLCINIDCYHEAAQHFLAALSMDHTPEDSLHANQSTNLYSTLKRVFAAMGRKDLESKVGAGMDLDSFRSEFDF